jgi:hypothetical protein
MSGSTVVDGSIRMAAAYLNRVTRTWIAGGALLIVGFLALRFFGRTYIDGVTLFNIDCLVLDDQGRAVPGASVYFSDRSPAQGGPTQEVIVGVTDSAGHISTRHSYRWGYKAVIIPFMPTELSFDPTYQFRVHSPGLEDQTRQFRQSELPRRSGQLLVSFQPRLRRFKYN